MPPRGWPPAYLRYFGRRDPHVALKVFDYVQREAIDRVRGKSVDGAVGLIALEIDCSTREAYRFLQAGRWLYPRRKQKWLRS